VPAATGKLLGERFEELVQSLSTGDVYHLVLR
jgi:hypothetical protein